MSRLSISLFGSFQVRLDGEPVSAFEADKVRALLAYLAVEADRPQRRETLAGLLWPDFSERSARANLRNALANLRRAIGDHQASLPFLHITRQTIQFDRASDYWLDVTAFTALLGTADTSDEQLAEVVALYQGSFLAGFSIPDSAAFEEWVLLRREAFSRQVMDALGRLANFYQECGAYEHALPHVRRQVELEPWHEEAHQQLMRLLALSGRRSEALAQYETCRRALADELGVEPAAETTALYEQIRTGELSRGAEERGSRGEKVSVVSLPTRILAPAYPHTPAHQHNLPAQTTPFVGREAELAELSSLLADPSRRLVTIFGPGGIGKTRLALEVATAELANYPHGVYFVPLARLQAAENMVSAIAEAVRYPFQTDDRSPREQLLDYFRQKKLLLLLDNVEHLLNGVSLITEILQAAPRMKVLTTSRERLKLSGETLFTLGGLDFPEQESENGGDYSAVKLFVQCAGRIQPSFKVTPGNQPSIARICYLVGGMPLGILLAAAWLDILSPAEVVAQMSGDVSQSLDFLETEWRDLPARQRSLRVVFERSWQRLSAAERKTFMALSVFRGGFTRQAAQMVTHASLRTLTGLVNKSFLQRDREGRFEIHELLRQYAEEHLESSGQAAVAREAHCAHYLDFLYQREADLKGRRQMAALNEIEVDGENVRVAWRWAAEGRLIEPLAQAVESLGLFYEWRGRYREGEAAFRLAVEKFSTAESGSGQRVLVRLLTWQAVFSRILGQVKLANHLLRQGLLLSASPGLTNQDTRSERAAILLQMGRAALRTADTEQANHLLQQSLALYRELDDQWEIAQVLFGLSSDALDAGAFDLMKEWLEECLSIQQALGDQRGVAYTLGRLSFNLLELGDYAEAERLARARLALHEEIGDWVSKATALHHLGILLLMLGQYAEAHLLLEESAALCQNLGERLNLTQMMANLAIIKTQLGRYEEAQTLGRMALTRAQKIGAQEIPGLVGLSLGPVALVKERYSEAQQRLQVSVAVYSTMGPPDLLPRSRILLAYAERGLGHVSLVWQHLYVALQETRKIQVLVALMHVLALLALLLVDQGEEERAVELYALASQHPIVANSCWFEDIAGRHIAAVAATLPPEVVAAAQARGRARALEATVTELLAELEEAWTS